MLTSEQIAELREKLQAHCMNLVGFKMTLRQCSIYSLYLPLNP